MVLPGESGGYISRQFTKQHGLLPPPHVVKSVISNLARAGPWHHIPPSCTCLCEMEAIPPPSMRPYQLRQLVTSSPSTIIINQRRGVHTYRKRRQVRVSAIIKRPSGPRYHTYVSRTGQHCNQLFHFKNGEDIISRAADGTTGNLSTKVEIFTQPTSCWIPTWTAHPHTPSAAPTASSSNAETRKNAF